MNAKLRKSLLILAACFSAAVVSRAVEPFELSLEENINTPAVPAKRHSAVRESADRLRSALDKAGFTVARLRQGEALMITLPCSDLFRSNADTLSPEGSEKLRRLSILDEFQCKYKILIAVHTDNTGEDGYADAITARRANAIDDYLTDGVGLSSMVIIPYGLGRDEPLVANDSSSGRAKNRRVEIFLIPQETLYSKNNRKK